MLWSSDVTETGGLKREIGHENIDVAARREPYGVPIVDHAAKVAEAGFDLRMYLHVDDIGMRTVPARATCSSNGTDSCPRIQLVREDASTRRRVRVHMRSTGSPFRADQPGGFCPWLGLAACQTETFGYKCFQG
jgi:hypothetical protein